MTNQFSLATSTYLILKLKCLQPNLFQWWPLPFPTYLILKPNMSFLIAFIYRLYFLSYPFKKYHMPFCISNSPLFIGTSWCTLKIQDLTKIPQDIREKKIRTFRHPKPVSGIILFGSWPSATFYVRGYNPCCSEGSSKAPEACAHMCNGELQGLCVHVPIPRERGEVIS